jgi:ubiquitin related modifier 1
MNTTLLRNVLILSISGGLEMLFGNQKKHNLIISSAADYEPPKDVTALVTHLADHVMKDSRKELFILHGSV